VNGTRFEPKKPKRLFKEPKIEKARRLAKVSTENPNKRELKGYNARLAGYKIAVRPDVHCEHIHWVKLGVK